MLLLPPLLSMFIHPMIHEPDGKAGRYNRWLGRVMRTRYFRNVCRHHWLHHKYPDCNFNLLLGGDRLLGTHRNPTATDLQDMDREGFHFN